MHNHCQKSNRSELDFQTKSVELAPQTTIKPTIWAWLREKKQDQEAQNSPSNPDHRRTGPAIADPLTHAKANHAIHETHRPTPSSIMRKEERKDSEEIEKEETGLRLLSLTKREREKIEKEEREKENILMEKREKLNKIYIYIY